MIKFLSVENVIIFHEKIIKETGGSYGIRDRGLIESALNRAFMTCDGNKRIGVAVMVIMLCLNNVLNLLNHVKFDIF